MRYFHLVEEFVRTWSEAIAKAKNAQLIFPLAEQWLQLLTLAGDLSHRVDAGQISEAEADTDFAQSLDWANAFMRGLLEGQPAQASWHDPGQWASDATALASSLLHAVGRKEGLSSQEREHLFSLLSGALAQAADRGLNRAETTALVSDVILDFVNRRTLTTEEYWGGLIAGFALAKVQPLVHRRYPISEWEERERQIALSLNGWLEENKERLARLKDAPLFDRSVGFLALLRDATEFLQGQVGQGVSEETLSPLDAASFLYSAWLDSPQFWRSYWEAIQPGWRDSSAVSILEGLFNFGLSVIFLRSNFKAIGLGLGSLSSALQSAAAYTSKLMEIASSAGSSGLRALARAAVKGTSIALRAGAARDFLQGAGLIIAGGVVPPIYYGFIALAQAPFEFKGTWDALIAMQTSYEWGPTIASFAERYSHLPKNELLAVAEKELFPILEAQGILASLGLAELGKALRVHPGAGLMPPQLPTGSSELLVTEELASAWVLGGLADYYAAHREALGLGVSRRLGLTWAGPFPVFYTSAIPKEALDSLVDLAALTSLEGLAGQILGKGKGSPWLNSTAPLEDVLALPIRLWSEPYTTSAAGIMQTAKELWESLRPGQYVLVPEAPAIVRMPGVRLERAIAKEDVARAIKLGVYRAWLAEGDKTGATRLFFQLDDFARRMAETYIGSGKLAADLAQLSQQYQGQPVLAVQLGTGGVRRLEDYRFGSEAEAKLLFLHFFAQRYGQSFYRMLKGYAGGERP